MTRRIAAADGPEDDPFSEYDAVEATYRWTGEQWQADSSRNSRISEVGTQYVGWHCPGITNPYE